MDQSCQKVLSVLTYIGIQTFTSSTLPIAFFPSMCQSRYLCIWKRLFVSKYLKKWSVHRNWNPDRPEMAKVLLVQNYLEIPTRPFWKLQLWILVSGSEFTFSYYFRTLAVKDIWFYSLHWLEFFREDLHRQLFSLKNAFLFQNQIKLSFLCRLDGKYRRATALLVLMNLQLAKSS